MNKKGKIFLNAYYLRQVADICSSMQAIPGSYRVIDIHKLRVQVKRIKSVFRLLEYRYPAEFKVQDHYHLFKPVFKSAGLLRESQINLRLLREYPVAGRLRKAYYTYITQLKSQWRLGLDAHIRSFNYKKLDDYDKRTKELISRNTESELVEITESFIYSELQRINTMLDGPDDLEYIHEVRILLKNIKPLLGLIWRRKDNHFTKSHYESLNEAETYIGNWHDRVVLSRSVTLFFNAIGKEKEKMQEEYSSLQKELHNYNKEAFDKIRSSLAVMLEIFTGKLSI